MNCDTMILLREFGSFCLPAKSRCSALRPDSLSKNRTNRRTTALLDESMIFYLYMYTHRESGKRYIGVTNNLKRRYQDHGNGRSGAGRFNNAIKKYGIEAFDFRILALFDNEIEAARIEQAAIKSFGTLSPNGLNLRAGAPYTQYSGTHSEETRAKMSVSWHRHHDHQFTPEFREKISVTAKGRTPWNKGVPPTLEQRQHMSSGQKRRIRSEESNQKTSVALKGRTVPQETRQKMSAAKIGKTPWNKGIPFSAEVRLKMSVSAKLRCAKQRENKVDYRVVEVELCP